MKNILITGGAGFIGSNVALRLLQKGYYVTVLDNLSKQIHGVTPEITSPLYLSIKDKVRFIHGSVVSREDWMKALDGQDAYSFGSRNRNRTVYVSNRKVRRY